MFEIPDDWDYVIDEALISLSKPLQQHPLGRWLPPVFVKAVSRLQNDISALL